MEEKISVAEISRLREAAEEERKTHQTIMRKIKQQKTGEADLSPDEQMKIVKRGNATEIRSMLEAFGIKGTIDEKVQIYIYDNIIGYGEIREYMLENCQLCLNLEKRIIDKGMHKYGKKHISPQAEVYLLKQSLTKSRDLNDISYILEVEQYIARYELSKAGQVELMSYLDIGYGRDSLIDKCEQCVRDYIFKYKALSLEAQRLLIKSGNHNAIMDYIQESSKGLEAEDELMERGNRKEVEAYFKRYATM